MPQSRTAPRAADAFGRRAWRLIGGFGSPAIGFWMLATLIVQLACSGALAHEIPERAQVVAFFVPTDESLHVAVRVPLETMRDIELPLREQGYVDLRADPGPLREAATLWILQEATVFADDRPLEGGEVTMVRISLPTDGAFNEVVSAFEHFDASPLPPDTDLFWTHAMLDVRLEYPLDARDSRIALRSNWSRIAVETQLRFVYQAENSKHELDFVGDPGLVVFDPGPLQILRTHGEQGARAVLASPVYLAFLFCLLLPLRQPLHIVWAGAAAALGCALTTMVSSLGLTPEVSWFFPYAGVLGSGCIVYLAVENILGWNVGRRWIAGYVAGLVLGIEFAPEVAGSLQLAADKSWLGVLAFAAGLMLAQVGAVLLVLAMSRSWPWQRRAPVIVASAFVAHAAWHWTLSRASAASGLPLAWPPVEGLTVTLLKACVVVGAAGFLYFVLLGAAGVLEKRRGMVLWPVQ